VTQTIRDIVATYPPDTLWTDGAQTWDLDGIDDETAGRDHAREPSWWLQPAIELSPGCIHQIAPDGYARSTPALKMVEEVAP